MAIIPAETRTGQTEGDHQDGERSRSQERQKEEEMILNRIINIYFSNKLYTENWTFITKAQNIQKCGMDKFVFVRNLIATLLVRSYIDSKANLENQNVKTTKSKNHQCKRRDFRTNNKYFCIAVSSKCIYRTLR